MVNRSLVISLVLLFSLTIIASAGIYIFKNTFSSPGDLSEETILIVPQGGSINSIGKLLETKGIINESLVFTWGVRSFGKNLPLIAGEYLIPPSVSPLDTMRILQSGKVVIHKLTIPEGLTTHQIFDLVNEADGLIGKIPPYLYLQEGTFLPETYLYIRGEGRKEFLLRMQKAMTITLNDLWNKRSSLTSVLNTSYEALILASIVERETSQRKERPKVAAVFLNRLKRGMRLQSDSTVVYGVSNRTGFLGRTLTKSDILTKNPYNSYIHHELPPGPISNPGRHSLIAAMNPSKTKALYFVANGSGGHTFSSTLREHNKNVARWRRFKAQN